MCSGEATQEANFWTGLCRPWGPSRYKAHNEAEAEIQSLQLGVLKWNHLQNGREVVGILDFNC